MDISSSIKQLAYHPSVVKFSQSLQIRNFMRWGYYFLARPKDNKKHFCFNGIEAHFYVNTPLELRLVETPFEKGMGNEKFFLNELLNILNPGDVVYDIGASIGIHTVFMSKKVGSTGKIIAFEPEDHSYQSLKTNIELNDLCNVVPLQSALGHMKAEGTLHSRGATADFSLTDRLEGKKYQKARIVTGDSLVKEMNLPPPKVVKIDVEGYEYYVIQGLKNTLTNGMCQMVCCEIHPTMLPHGTTPERVIELLKSYGFECIKNHPRGETIHTFCYKG